MKRFLIFITVSLILLLAGNALATFNSGSTGADGAFNPTANTQLQLPPDGIFNFTTINIPSSVTVTFTKNAENTPVYMLATGDVTIAGTIDVSGGDLACITEPGAGGPGGYSGGNGGPTNVAGGKGLGPGGGEGAPSPSYQHGGGGGFGTSGRTYPGHGIGGPIYGNASLIPLIGGSGGGGGAGRDGHPGYGGGGGGGAILIASSGTITISGTIKAEGGAPQCSWGGGGSGGAIKLMANSIYGSGTLSAKGGVPTQVNGGGAGRTRIEAYINTFGGTSDPAYSLNVYSLTNPPGSVRLMNLF